MFVRSGIIIVVLLGGVLLYSARSQPENAVIQFLQHINNGEYSQAADLLVDSNTLQPLSDSQKAYLTTTMENTLGPNGGNIRINNITILSKQKINDNQYLITVSEMVSINSNGFQKTSGTATVVNVNGQWKLAESITGLSSSQQSSVTNPTIVQNNMFTPTPTPLTQTYGMQLPASLTPSSQPTQEAIPESRL